jgi:hypothetical protein
MKSQESKTPFIVLGAGLVALLAAVSVVFGFAIANSQDGGSRTQGEANLPLGNETLAGPRTEVPVSTPVSPMTTPSSSSTPSPTAPPAPTNTPSASATPMPTTPAPTRTLPPSPLLVPLPSASSGSGNASGRHTGVLGLVLAAAEHGLNTGNGRIQISAAIPTIGSLEHPVATAWLDRPFFVPPNLGSSVDAQVSGKVDWRGVLAGNGVAGAGAEVNIVLKLLDGTRVVAQTVVHTKEVREGALSVGGLADNGAASPTLSARVVGGRSYVLRLEASCEATSGLLGAVAHCIFGPSSTYGNGFVHWGGFEAELVP